MLDKTHTRYGEMYYYLNDQFIGASLQYYGEYTKLEIDYVSPYLKDDDIVIDIGANIGTHTPNIISSEQVAVRSGTNIASFGLDRIHFDSSNYYVLNASSVGVKLVNGATAWTTQSDENLKENIVELTGAIDKIKDYRCVEYNLITDETKSKKIGFIAQDWQKDYNQIIDKDDDGNLGIRYTETIPVLLKAIQEQQTQIEALQSEINKLKGE